MPTHILLHISPVPDRDKSRIIDGLSTVDWATVDWAPLVNQIRLFMPGLKDVLWSVVALHLFPYACRSAIGFATNGRFACGSEPSEAAVIFTQPS